jgi:hypothetical protein
MPGTPITNLGTKVSHPNTDDVLVQRWDAGLSRWQTVHYDSGIRSVTLVNGWTGALYCRRIDNLVYWFPTSLSPLNASAKSSHIMFASVPTAFRMAASLAVGAVYPTVGQFYAQDVTTTYFIKYEAPAGPALSILPTNFTGALNGGMVCYQTDAAIPTSLPGTLVSAAPA